jgi:hypothetical protein
VQSCTKTSTSGAPPDASLISNLVQRLHGQWTVFMVDYLMPLDSEMAVSVLHVSGVCCASEVRSGCARSPIRLLPLPAHPPTSTDAAARAQPPAAASC